MIRDKTNTDRLYVAITSRDASSYASTGIYTCTNGGTNWSKVFDFTNSGGTIQATEQTAIRLATGPSGSVAAEVINLETQTVTGIFLSKDNGTNWTQLSSTANFPYAKAQAAINSTIAIDPGNPNIVYVSGTYDPDNPNSTADVYRLQLKDGSVTITDMGSVRCFV